MGSQTVNLIPEELDAHRLVRLLRRKNLQYITAHAERTAVEIHIIPVILNINQLPDHIVPVLFHSRAERNNHLHVVLRASDSIDTRNTGNHNDIVPLTQCRSRGKPQLINLIVPRRVLRNIRIRRRHVTDLRSKTQGRGVYVMQMDHFEKLPDNLIEKINK